MNDLVDVILGIIHQIAYDLATDSSDFHAPGAAMELANALADIDPKYKDVCEEAVRAAVQSAASDCGEDEFEPVTELVLFQKEGET